MHWAQDVEGTEGHAHSSVFSPAAAVSSVLKQELVIKVNSQQLNAYCAVCQAFCKLWACIILFTSHNKPVKYVLFTSISQIKKLSSERLMFA